ncbi:hypothetical protein [Parageobacillus thermoglucosidasius]|nr:hypothetical protein [Parageobacillus thermoglucosidasius]
MEEKRAVIVNQPSTETMMRVYAFFMRTSIPRILAEEKRKKEVIQNENRA